jgi:hypothetical protein
MQFFESQKLKSGMAGECAFFKGILRISPSASPMTADQG